MKFTLFAAWSLLCFAVGLSAAPPARAQAGAPSPPLPSPPPSVRAVGRALPLGAHVDLTWPAVGGAAVYKVYRDSQYLAKTSRPLWIDYAVAAGETHAYAVTSVGPGGESAPSGPASALVPGGGQVIYADALVNGWQCWGWASLDLANAAPAQSSRSIRVTAGPWQALYLHHAAGDTTPYAALSLWVNGGPSGGQSVAVCALRGGIPQTPVALDPLPAGAWRQETIPLSALGVADVADMDGLWVEDTTGTAQPSFYVDSLALLPAGLPAPMNLAVSPQWVAHCPQCGMAMPHMILSWSAVPGAASYTVCRDGATVASGTVTAPVNLSVQGAWLGGPADTLTWAPVPGAASYTVYQYGVPLATGVLAPTYVVPTASYSAGMTYTVTAVDSMGTETLPSAPATAQGAADPTLAPSWMPNAPTVPTQIVATPEWNAGVSRIHLSWRGSGADYTYNVYRDGQPTATGLWGLNYFDVSVGPGETHSYTVTGVNDPWTASVESLPGATVSATALSGPPSGTGGVVQITNVQADDDSVVVSFVAVPGAVDYRVYNAANPNTVKYSGGGLSIEMNGLDPSQPATLVVEAVDKMGPFQKMDGMAGPGAMQMDGMHEAINGQGDPSDVPLALAASAPFPVTFAPAGLTGSQSFFDTFRNEQPLTLQPPPPAPQGDYYGVANQYAEYDNDKWAIRNYGGDITDSAVFFMGNHFMDTLYDGGTPHTSDPMHNNDASLVLMPRATADISGGQVLHVTFEVDGHFDSRRWCDLQVAAAGDTLIRPGKTYAWGGPTPSGTELRWTIDGEFHRLMLLQNAGTPDALNIQETDMVHLNWQGDYSDRSGSASRTGWTDAAGVSHPATEGTTQDLDKRHKFDLYLSQTHYRLMENGVVCKDGDFPAGATLPFTQCQVYFVHQLYHTANDRNEQLAWDTGNSYWYNYRPWCDERHWDNCGQEVLPAFPALPSP